MILKVRVLKNVIYHEMIRVADVKMYFIMKKKTVEFEIVKSHNHR